MKENIAEAINILGEFCGKRDIPVLESSALRMKYGIEQADVMVLFGGSILCGGDVLAQAMRNKAAKTYVIAGGAGHTTETLRIRMQEEFPDIETAGLPEAKVFAAYLDYKYGLKADYLECNSTNCGNNITYVLKLLEEKEISFQSIILAQDASMQHRMEAGLRKYIDDNITIINYAVYDIKVVLINNDLLFDKEIRGMWDMDHYITLLMGEIPRLLDHVDGYGPNGKNFIAHVDVPDTVYTAFLNLKAEYGNIVREANSLFASTK